MKKRSKKSRYIITLLAALLLLGALRDMNLLPSFEFLLARLPEVAALEKVVSGDVLKIVRPKGVVGSPDIAVNQTTHKSIVVWHEKGQTDYDVYAARLDSQGALIGSSFMVNGYRKDDQKFPRIAMNAAGDFVVVWQSYGEDGSAAGVYGQKFTANGEKSRSEFRVNTTLDNNQMLPDVAMNAAGDFIVVWKSESKKDSGINAQSYDAEGASVGKEFAIVKDETGKKDVKVLTTNPAVSMSETGEAIVVWQVSRGSGSEIHGRALNAQGQGLGGETLISAIASGSKSMRPRVTSMPQKQFMVVWEEETTKEKVRNIVFQRDSIQGQVLDAQGNKIGANVEIFAPALTHEQAPDIAATPKGAMVVWQAYHRNKAKDDDDKIRPGYWEVLGQKLDLAGNRAGEWLSVGADPDEFQWTPAIAGSADNSYTVVWGALNLSEIKAAIALKQYSDKQTQAMIRPQSPARSAVTLQK
ncbi:hypothetical protein HZA43_03220 [Candidatus Peregrinibacteria bacterium]|nr:hypothetical protein [Candidatus Peregrinibacteria bacterium]